MSRESYTLCTLFVWYPLRQINFGAGNFTATLYDWPTNCVTKRESTSKMRFIFIMVQIRLMTVARLRHQCNTPVNFLQTITNAHAVQPMKFAHGFPLVIFFRFGVGRLYHLQQGYFSGTRAILRLSRYQ